MASKICTNPDCGRSAGKDRETCATCGSLTRWKDGIDTVDAGAADVGPAAEHPVDPKALFDELVDDMPTDVPPSSAEAPTGVPAEAIKDPHPSKEGGEESSASTVVPSYEVEVLSGPRKGATQPLSADGNVVLGAGSDADLQLDHDGYLSRQHAILGLEDGQIVLEDAGSSNGTFVKIEEAVFLEPGTVILLGIFIHVDWYRSPR